MLAYLPPQRGIYCFIFIVHSSVHNIPSIWALAALNSNLNSYARSAHTNNNTVGRRHSEYIVSTTCQHSLVDRVGGNITLYQQSMSVLYLARKIEKKIPGITTSPLNVSHELSGVKYVSWFV